ncbi:MAG: hypothetical protein K6F23_01160 [Solobacterium sp.]|nr:hypothetical protein [Solobacterium sp.]
MKQFLCILATLAASAGLLFLVSAPINSEHGGESSHEETHAEETVDSAEHGEIISSE